MAFFMYFCTKITDMRKIWLFILIVIFLTSCRTVRYIDRNIIDSTEIEVPITNTKIEHKDRFLHDSIYIHDSIFTLIKGDTVYIYRNKDFPLWRQSGLLSRPLYIQEGFVAAFC